MAKNLVIVESPAKAKTLEGFLGKDYKVVSSYGHIADLPSKGIGIDLETFAPEYIVNDDKKKIVGELKKLADKSETIWLASDEDREGEAIAWHLSQQLGLDNTRTKRIVFNAITKRAVLGAIESPRKINYDLVNAQQARRVLDRLVGYELSPVLWKKVRRGLSAGRVQSVAVRLIVEREREIEGFSTKSLYKVSAHFRTSDEAIVKANLSKNFNTESEAKTFVEKNIGATFNISNQQVRPTKRHPAAPFTTSTLQQEASRKLGFSVGRTMSVAQRLYESGFITYMRTDSNNLSPEAITAAKTAIIKRYGESYSHGRKYTTKSKGAQEAHEAIRPTDILREHINAERDQTRLYDLIWKRSIASQMSSAELKHTEVEILADKFSEKYIAKGEVITFEGFLKVYLEGNDDEDTEDTKGILPPLKVGENLTYEKITAIQRYDRPPARYTEAALVKQLEKLGIGRPSTYAPTISTIQNRGYVEKGDDTTGQQRDYTQIVLSKDKLATSKLTETTGSKKGKLIPTLIGNIVNDFLVENFKTILDFNFTAKVEASFDDIALGQEDWKKMIGDFYTGFHPQVIHVEQHAKRQSGERLLGTDPTTKKPVYVRLAKFGPVAQIGNQEEEENLQFAGLLPTQHIDKITLDEALALFQLPKILGDYKNLPVEANSSRYGPYVKYDKKFISIPKTEDVFAITLDRAIELIQEKARIDAPIAQYRDEDVTKGKGRFGPFIKWSGMFINVSKKYDFDNLSQADIEVLIENKIKREAEKIVKIWEEEGIRIEKGRWKRYHIIKGKKKIELSKDTDIDALTLEQVKSYLDTKKKKK